MFRNKISSEVWYCPYNEEIFIVHKAPRILQLPGEELAMDHIVEFDDGKGVRGRPDFWFPYSKRICAL